MTNFEDIRAGLQEVMDLQFQLPPLMKDGVTQHADVAGGNLQVLKLATDLGVPIAEPMRSDRIESLVQEIDQGLGAIEETIESANHVVRESREQLLALMAGSIALADMAFLVNDEGASLTTVARAASSGRETLRQLPWQPPLPRDPLDSINEDLHICNEHAGVVHNTVYALRDQVNDYLGGLGLPPVTEP